MIDCVFQHIAYPSFFFFLTMHSTAKVVLLKTIKLMILNHPIDNNNNSLSESI